MSASARTARIRDTVISRGFKVQNSNGIAATSTMRGVLPCVLNFNRLIYKLPKCQVVDRPFVPCPIPIPDLVFDGGNPYFSGIIYDGGYAMKTPTFYNGGNPLQINPLYDL